MPSEDSTPRDLQLSPLTIQHLTDVIVWITADGSIRQVNDAVRRFGFTPEELAGKTVRAVLPQLDETEVTRWWEACARRGFIRLQIELSSGHGTSVPFDMSGDLIEHEGTSYLCCVLRERTEQKNAEATLREREEQYRNLVEMANDGIIIVQDNVIKYINPRFTSIFGIAEAGDRRLDLESLLHPDHREETMRRYRRHCAGEDVPSMFESSMVHRDGHRIPVEVNVGIVPWHGRPALIVEIRDITLRKKAEQELLEALREVKELKNRLEAENVYLQQEIRLTHNFEEIITRTETVKDLLRKVEQVASTDATVLILGETGTGKELVARAIHNISRRAERPLVKVNCAALPANLIESELFGHEKGAFTGASAKKMGRFELADGGTIFLDEIGDLPPDLQVKLLRVLQDGEFERLGSSQTITVDVRVIAATNRDLEGALRSGSFREDLFYRLNVFPIVVPPLRERKDDIPILVQHFVTKYAAKIGKKVTVIPQSVIDRLLAYEWPGNVRELEHVVERAVILSEEGILQLAVHALENHETKSPRRGSLDDIEREHILQTLQQTGWRVSGEKGAARILGINPQTLFSRMKKLAIRRPGTP